MNAIKQASALMTTTRMITGKTTVPGIKLKAINSEAGTAVFTHEGTDYDAVQLKHTRNRVWVLTGDYTH